MSARLSARLLACSVALVTLAFPAGAHAITASFTPPRLAIVAGPGELNDVTVTVTGTETVVIDAVTPPLAGPGCFAPGDGTVRCPVPDSCGIELSDGNDRARWNCFEATVEGGPGNDDLAGPGTLDGGPGTDVLAGAAGADRLNGGPGSDLVAGGDGPDVLIDAEDDPSEPDALDGGVGVDRLDFGERATAVTVDLSTTPQTGGSAGEGNAVAGFEVVAGGRGNDALTGSPLAPRAELAVLGGSGDDRIATRSATGAALDGGHGDDRIDGGPGPDRISGGPGRDVLRGGAGADRIDGLLGDDDLGGGSGDDRLDGGTGADRVDGGAGADILIGHSARDLLIGGAGNDSLRARDRNRDRGVRCGPGRDRVQADRIDPVSDCEVRLR